MRGMADSKGMVSKGGSSRSRSLLSIQIGNRLRDFNVDVALCAGPSHRRSHSSSLISLDAQIEGDFKVHLLRSEIVVIPIAEIVAAISTLLLKIIAGDLVLVSLTVSDFKAVDPATT